MVLIYLHLLLALELVDALVVHILESGGQLFIHNFNILSNKTHIMKCRDADDGDLTQYCSVENSPEGMLCTHSDGVLTKR